MAKSTLRKVNKRIFLRHRYKVLSYLTLEQSLYTYCSLNDDSCFILLKRLSLLMKTSSRSIPSPESLDS